MLKNRGFTLIELLIIIAIISLLMVAIFVSVNQSRKNARINGAKTSMKSVLPAIIACKDGGGTVSNPGSGGGNICQTAVGFDNSKWPELAYGYAYGSGIYDSVNCNFTVNTNQDETKLGFKYITCNCIKQICE